MTRGAERSSPAVVGPSNIPHRSPCTSRRSSRATSRPSSSSSRSSVRSDAAGARRSGPAAPRPPTGTVGTVGPSVAAASATPNAARSRGSRLRPRQAPANEDSSSICRRAVLPLPVHHPPTCSGSGVQWVEPDGAAGPQCHRSHAPGGGQVAVLTLGVDHPGPAAEDGLAPEERLDEGALAPADLAEHHHVGIGHHPLGVELEGIEDERPAQQVVTDDDAPLPEPGFGNEGVGRAEVARGDLVGGDARAGYADHRRERSPGRSSRAIQSSRSRSMSARAVAPESRSPTRPVPWGRRSSSRAKCRRL